MTRGWLVPICITLTLVALGILWREFRISKRIELETRNKIKDLLQQIFTGIGSRSWPQFTMALDYFSPRGKPKWSYTYSPALPSSSRGNQIPLWIDDICKSCSHYVSIRYLKEEELLHRLGIVLVADKQGLLDVRQRVHMALAIVLVTIAISQEKILPKGINIFPPRDRDDFLAWEIIPLLPSRENVTIRVNESSLPEMRDALFQTLESAQWG